MSESANARHRAPIRGSVPRALGLLLGDAHERDPSAPLPILFKGPHAPTETWTRTYVTPSGLYLTQRTVRCKCGMEFVFAQHGSRQLATLVADEDPAAARSHFHRTGIHPAELTLNRLRTRFFLLRDL